MADSYNGTVKITGLQTALKNFNTTIINAGAGAPVRLTIDRSGASENVEVTPKQATVDGKPWGKTAPAPALPPEVIAKTLQKYEEALQRLTS